MDFLKVQLTFSNKQSQIKQLKIKTIENKEKWALNKPSTYASSIDRLINFMQTILIKVIPDNLKACPRFVRCTCKVDSNFPSIEIPLLGTPYRLMK